MGKCTIIGTIRAPSTVGQAVRINGKKCDEETVWNVTAYGGESVVTDFTIDNRSSVDFDIVFDISTASDSEYTAEILDELDNPVSFPFSLTKETKNWKLKITFDKYITEGSYDIEVIFDFSP